jgi:putative glutamine amidotransferase
VYDRHGHEVAFEHQSYLGRVYGAERGRVNSVHHQAIKDLGRGLVVEARSEPDGVVEAVRFASPESSCFALGVQWHPEFMQDTSPDGPNQDVPALAPEPLMTAFLNEVASRRLRREDRERAPSR